MCHREAFKSRSAIVRESKMNPIRFWIPVLGGMREVIVQGEYVETIIAGAAEHEAGHIVAAYHLDAEVLGIALGFLPERSQTDLLLQAFYGWENASVETKCVVLAAGPAADIIFHNQLNEIAASGDLRDIQGLTGRASLEPYLTTARAILSRHTGEVKCVADALRQRISVENHRTCVMPNNHLGVMLVDEAQLKKCLAGST